MVDLDEVRALPGKKIIIRGNHDYWFESVSKLTRLAGGGGMTFVQNDCIPVDGGRIAVSLLPYPLAVRFSQLERWGFPILLVLLFTGLLGDIMRPFVVALKRLIVLLIS